LKSRSAAASAGAIRIEECGGALLLHVGVGREVLKRQHVVGGQADNSAGIDRTSEFTSSAER
jgi:hypothetical protein